MPIPPDALRHARSEYPPEDVIGMCVLAILVPLVTILVFAL